MSEKTCVKHEWLRDLSTRIQVGFGISEKDAVVITDLLVETSLMGLDTHGIIRLKFYMDRVRAGGIGRTSEMRVVRDNPCTALIEGDNGLGPVGATLGMELAIEKAKKNGIGLVLVRDCNHYGPAGYYTRMALPHDMIGVSLTNVLASMPPTGGAEARQGNNPYSIAFPAGEEPPVVVDGATSVSSWGTLYVCTQKGEKLPADCYVDAEGNMTIEPQAVLNGGCLLPIAGYKGYGISVAIELMTGMLAGSDLDHIIPHPYKELDKPGRNSYVMAAFRIDQFIDPAEFKRNMDNWIRFMRDTRRAPGVDRIWLPGEKELVTRAQRLDGGIPLDAEMLSELETLAKEAGVEL